MPKKQMLIMIMCILIKKAYFKLLCNRATPALAFILNIIEEQKKQIGLPIVFASCFIAQKYFFGQYISGSSKLIRNEKTTRFPRDTYKYTGQNIRMSSYNLLSTGQNSSRCLYHIISLQFYATTLCQEPEAGMH